MKRLEDFIYPTQKRLFKKLCKKYGGQGLCIKDSFILVEGTAPIMLVAHLDTVHEKPVREICKTVDGNILMSPQGIGGDDRCGVYAICTAYELAPKKPWLLFTCNEEIGGIGAECFCRAYSARVLTAEIDTLKFIVEIDRRGSHDAVYYDCDNPAFEKYVSSKGFVTAQGSFSDISLVAPELGIAAVNLSSGYYNAHTLHEYIVRSELESTIERVCEMVADSALPDFPRYEYYERARADFGSADDYYSSLAAWAESQK